MPRKLELAEAQPRRPGLNAGLTHGKPKTQAQFSKKHEKARNLKIAQNDFLCSKQVNSEPKIKSPMKPEPVPALHATADHILHTRKTHKRDHKQATWGWRRAFYRM